MLWRKQSCGPHVDPGNARANPADPQTWNIYTYVGNNPLSYTDPSGMEGGEVGACAANPIACGVVIGVELGITLSHVFGNLGYSGPPVPNWSGTAWGTGPAQAPNYNDGPWSERNPYGGSGGVNTGGVFGSGNTGPFVFSFEGNTQPQTGWQYLGAYWSTAGFLANFLTGTGPRSRNYGPNDYRTRDLMSSRGFGVINQQIKQACQAGKTAGAVEPFHPAGLFKHSI